MNSFNDFGLAEPLTRALAAKNYVTPTPIQVQTIPTLLEGRDLIGIAQTGTGKTAAFALPILHKFAASRIRSERKSCRALILSPTRELSDQILESFKTYGRHLQLQFALVIGGIPMNRQVRALANGVDVLVATPGRLLDLMRSGAVRLDRVEVFVLDEADRMLDMGFINDIRTVIGRLPPKRQTLLFSATMPHAISELAGQMLKDPVKVSVTPVATTVDRVAQRIIHVDRGAKQAMLADILRQEPVDRALVFTRTKHGADKVVRGLIKSGIAAEAIHGNKSQSQRERVLAAFRSGKVRTLVATDIAARGIDVQGISHVINFDLPNEPESYVHRIGRTARAGAEGIAISFCAADENAYLRDIEKLIRMSIPATGTPARGVPHKAAPHRHSGRPNNGGRHQQQAKSRNNRPQRQFQSPNGQKPSDRQERQQGQGRQPDRQPRHESKGDIGAMPFMQRQDRPQKNQAGDARRAPR